MRLLPTSRRAVPLAALFLVLALTAVLSAAAQDDPISQDEWTQLDQKEGDGETCLVCKQQIHGAEVVELRYRGRTFFVKLEMLGDFAADPEQYFQSLEARAGLFDETALRRPMALGWFYFGVYVVLGLIASAICGALAVRRGLSPLPWFFAGLVGNLAALVVLAATVRGTVSVPCPDGATKIPSTRAPIHCPGCGRELHPVATACDGCGKTLAPTVQPETARV